MSEIAQVSESLVLRTLGNQPHAALAKARETPLSEVVLNRLFREIGTYLEFVAIARGR